MSEKRSKTLAKLKGWTWDDEMYRWEFNYKAWKKHMKEFGYVSFSHSAPLETRQIAQWEGDQRKRKRNGKLATERIRILDNDPQWNWISGGKKSKFLPFKKARKFARSLNFNSASEWKAYASSESRPKDIPNDPRTVYAEGGWISHPDWLGY